jgi:hypothetical protein
MDKRLPALTVILAASAVLVGASVTSSYAATPTSSTYAPHELDAPLTGHAALTRSSSAMEKDVGPSSTIVGTSVDDPRGGANSGLPRVAGAPSAGSTGLGGH